MKKPASLGTVLEVSTMKRDEALQALGKARQELRQAEDQLSQLQGYVQEMQARWSQRAAQGINPSLLLYQQQFMTKIDHAVEFQRGLIQRMQLNIEHCQQQVMLAERELASLNKYAERREQVWQKQVQRQEQKSNDEMAANQARQQASSETWRHPA